MCGDMRRALCHRGLDHTHVCMFRSRDRDLAGVSEREIFEIMPFQPAHSLNRGALARVGNIPRTAGKRVLLLPAAWCFSQLYERPSLKRAGMTAGSVEALLRHWPIICDHQDYEHPRLPNGPARLRQRPIFTTLPVLSALVPCAPAALDLSLLQTWSLLPQAAFRPTSPQAEIQPRSVLGLRRNVPAVQRSRLLRSRGQLSVVQTETGRRVKSFCSCTARRMPRTVFADKYRCSTRPGRLAGGKGLAVEGRVGIKPKASRTTIGKDRFFFFSAWRGRLACVYLSSDKYPCGWINKRRPVPGGQPCLYLQCTSCGRRQHPHGNLSHGDSGSTVPLSDWRCAAASEWSPPPPTSPPRV